MNVSGSFIPLEQKLEPTQRPSPRVVKQAVHLLAGTPMTERKHPWLDWTSRASCWVEKPTPTRSLAVVSFRQRPQSAEQLRGEHGPRKAWGKAGFCTWAVTRPQIYTRENTAPRPGHTQTCTHTPTHTDRHTQSQGDTTQA